MARNSSLTLPPLTPRTAMLLAGAAGLVAAILVLWTVGDWGVAIGFVAAAVVLGAAAMILARAMPSSAQTVSTVDWSLARTLTHSLDEAIAITDRGGRLVSANDRYEALFPALPTPPGFDLVPGSQERVAAAGREAWRSGTGLFSGTTADGQAVTIRIERAGDAQDLLVWRVSRGAIEERVAAFSAALDGEWGDRLGQAGIAAAVVQPDGMVLSANAALTHRALAQGGTSLVGHDLAQFLLPGPGTSVRFTAEQMTGATLRLLQLPFGDDAHHPLLIALIDEEARDTLPAIGASGDVDHVRALISIMPFGMALVDREGRIVHMNDAFVQAGAIDRAAPPLYPGDLVVREDKAAVADAVRRLAGGGAHSTDVAVRLKHHPDEPVALTVAGARGLGDASVLLSLKTNSEEAQLKREVAQATKMQAVGQLAGGVAHDFNNILTAIIGHCDLMLMRHSPGDSDYDDIQQIRTNSHRAASLTRQLLAFSRQQTLRPQVLQLPDVVSEVSILLKRLMGETVTLEVRHGRDLGAVRADPGQLEQVVVNLAVNARDAMAGKPGGGRLTIQTRAATRDEVRRRGSDIMPAGNYTALEISDTGAGIPPEVLPKIFEPFFTTKEVGKGTGLGLSTVYGIVKQSGGYIFADSRPGQGATFTIYLPVHAGDDAPEKRKPPRAARADALWGSGTVLLVEDEEMVRAVAERSLVRQGYTVMIAENGEAALELLAGGDRPDLLISDVVMPVMDGPTMARRIRERFPDLPILFMSGYAEEQLRRSIDLDQVSFLPKPFSVLQLAEAARDALAGVE